MSQHFLKALCLLLVATGPAFALPKWQQFPPPPPMPPADQSGFADVRGISMFYSVYGKDKGSPILLIHGGMSSSDVWSFEVPTLAQHHEVIVADSRGQGRSTHGLAWLTYHRMAEDYVALLDMLKVDKVTLVGWSDGGIIGIDMAIHHPKLLDRLFAQAPNVTPDGLTSIPTIDPPPLSDDLLPSGAFEADPEREKAHRHQMARERVFRRLWATEPNYSDADLAKIHVPTAIVIGDHDPVIRPEHIAHIAHAIPGAKLVVLKDVGHPAHSQDPNQYLKAIQDFMGETPAAGPAATTAPKATPPPAAVAEATAPVKATPQAAAVAQAQAVTAPKAPQAAAAPKSTQPSAAVAQAAAPKPPVAQTQAKAAAKPAAPSAVAEATTAPKAPQAATAPKVPQLTAAVAQAVAPKAAKPPVVGKPQMATAPKAPPTAVAQSQTTATPKPPQTAAPKTPQPATVAQPSAPHVAKRPLLIVPATTAPGEQPAANSQTAGLATDQRAVQ